MATYEESRRLGIDGYGCTYTKISMPGPEFYVPDTMKDEIVEIGTDLKALNAMGKRLQQRYSDVDGLNEKDEENVPYYANFIFGGGQGVMTICVEKLSEQSPHQLIDIMTPKSITDILEKYLPVRIDAKLPKEFLLKCLVLLAAQEPGYLENIKNILSMEDVAEFFEVAYFDSTLRNFICTMKVNKYSKTKKTMKCAVSKEDIKQGDMIIGFNAKLHQYDCPTWYLPEHFFNEQKMKRRNVIYPSPGSAANIEGFSLLREEDRVRMLELIQRRHRSAQAQAQNPLKRQRV
ncbi:hypothetical protein B484DRAFT_448779 [Ochromonadaceae sp. CCMP2298]|nr:hypothetical protein B484DRAFT_448779 [Ochromonadaceae sp. CCMP2298]